MRHVLGLFLLALTVVGLSGCGPSGPKRYPVSGVVNFDGKPLQEGHIVLMPADGKGAPDAGPITDGKFSFEALPGTKKVEITASREEGEIDPVMGQVKRKQYIAPRFNVETTLEATITTGKNDLPPFEVSEK